MPYDRFNRHRRHGRSGPYRSKLEEDIGADLIKLGYAAEYESGKFQYVLPPRRYTPDFKIGDFFIEIKGWLSSSDRTKLLSVMKSNPELPLFVALQQPHQPIRKGSKTSVCMWCQKHHIHWCPTPIPAEFLRQWAMGERPTFRVLTPKDADQQMLLNSTMTDQFTVTHAVNTSGRRRTR